MNRLVCQLARRARGPGSRARLVERHVRVALHATLLVPVRLAAAHQHILVETPIRWPRRGARTRRKRCLVTGSTAGIGLETARLLAGRRHGRDLRSQRGAQRRRSSARRRRPRAAPTSRRASSAKRPARSAGSTCSSTTSASPGRRASRTSPTRSGTHYWQLNVMSYVRAIRAALPHPARRRRRDRERLVDCGQAPVDRDAALLRDEGCGALAVAPGRRSVRGRRDSL